MASSPARPPCGLVLGGADGAGKSTAAPSLLCGALRLDEFVSSDVLAQGLSAFRPEAAAVEAARVMLRRFEELDRARRRFACESRLASVTLANRLRDAILRHKQLGQRVATWKNGRVVVLEGHPIPVEVPVDAAQARSR